MKKYKIYVSKIIKNNGKNVTQFIRVGDAFKHRDGSFTCNFNKGYFVDGTFIICENDLSSIHDNQ